MSLTPARRSRSPLAVVRRAVPAIVGVAVIVGLGAASLGVGDANLRTAEADRLRERTDMVVGVGPNAAADLEAQQMSPLVDAAGFTLDNPAANELALRRFQIDSTGDSPTLVALLTVDGRRLAAAPAGSGIEVATLGPSWSAARGGRSAATPAFVHDGVVSYATLLPIYRRAGEEQSGGSPWAVLVLVNDAGNSLRQNLFTQIGSLNGEPGGLMLVDANGVALNSWNAANVGVAVLAPDTVRSLPSGRAEVWQTERDGSEITLVGTALTNGYAFLFEQQTDRLYGDLRAAQHQRDLVLLAVLAGTLAGLVTFQVIRERAARRAEARIHALLENSEDLVLVADASGRLSFISPAIRSLLGHDAAEWRLKPLTDLAHPLDVDRIAGLLGDAGSGPLLNVRLRRGDGEFEWFDVEASDLRGHREVGGILLTGHAVGHRKQLQDQLSWQATHDRLTGLPNRAELTARLDGRWLDGRPTHRFAFLYVDLDLFKPVNDALGHDAGDHVLRTVAERLGAVAGSTGFVCRLGGDEFGVLVDHAGEEEALAAADRLRAAARAPIAVAASLVHVDATIGIALADPKLDPGPPELLVRRADQAMFRAKRAGRGRALVAPPETAVPASALPLAEPVTDASTLPRPETGADAGEPATAWPGPADHPSHHRRSRLVVVAPVLVVAGIVVGIATFGFLQTRASQQAAEDQRVNERLRVTTRSADFYSRQFDPARIGAIAGNLPWSLDGSAIDQAIVKGYGETFSGNGDGWDATLATVDGRVLAGYPAGTARRFPIDGAVWRAAAVDGQVGLQPLVEVSGQLRSYFLTPILRDGRVAAVLTLGIAAEDAIAQKIMEEIGGIGLATGGWSLLDRHGVAFASWDRSLVGRQIAEPGDLAHVEPGQRPPSLSNGTGRVVVSGRMASMSGPEPTYLAFVQPADDFFRDLRLGQGVRDASLLLVVLVAVAGLAVLDHRRNEALRRSERRLDALMQHAHDIVVVLDRAGRATFVSSAVTSLLGYDPAERLGRTVDDLVHPDDRAQLGRVTTEARTHRSTSIADVRLRDASGNYRWFDIDALDLHDHREVAGLLLTCHEIGERKAYQDELAYRAEHDALTGLPNRAMFADELAALAAGADKTAFAVLFLDLDHFKPINDTLGHVVGDLVLCAIAGRLAGSVRGDGEHRADVVCRMGGDEFAILLRDATEERARDMAERILGVVAEPIAVAGTVVTVGATIGISLSHPDREHPDHAVRHADLAMYEAKAAGRHRYTLSGDPL